MTDMDWKAIQAAFAARFDDSEHKQRPGRGGRSFTYVDARAVQDRLDAVVGPGGWSIRFEVVDQAQGSVKCALTVLGVTKEDFGYPNNGEESDEPLKQAASDALKRAGCQFGIGRYLWQSSAGQRPPQQTGNRPAETFAERVFTPPARPPETGGQQESRPILPATEAQLRAIFAIGRKRTGWDDEAMEAHTKNLYGVSVSALTRRQASELIDSLNGGAER